MNQKRKLSSVQDGNSMLKIAKVCFGKGSSTYESVGKRKKKTKSQSKDLHIHFNRHDDDSRVGSICGSLECSPVSGVSEFYNKTSESTCAVSTGGVMHESDINYAVDGCHQNLDKNNGLDHVLAHWHCAEPVQRTRLGTKFQAGYGSFCQRADLKPTYVSLDCEFVGVEPGDKSALGRCSVVDFNGNVLCDIYVKPEQRIMNYRTRYSGLRARDMVNAVPSQFALKTITKVIKNKIVVGHSLHNDFSVMGLPHQCCFTRDISKYVPLRHMAGLDPSKIPSLKRLSALLLGRNIQRREHCSVEDAKATMDLFKLVCEKWEEDRSCLISKQSTAAQWPSRTRTTSNNYMDDEFWPGHVV